MNEVEEQFYMQGRRAAWVYMLRECLKNLGYNSEEGQQAAWIVEREEAIVRLRELCGSFGDNDWPNSLHLADIIEKHLADHLYGAEDE